MPRNSNNRPRDATATSANSRPSASTANSSRSKKRPRPLDSSDEEAGTSLGEVAGL
jgi:hypothetical protein